MTAEERDRRLRTLRSSVGWSPTFQRAVEGGQGSRPIDVELTVITSARTYSAAFDIAATLVRHGARSVGVPSAQAGNCFIDGLWFELEHSGLYGSISYKRALNFPDDPERGRLLRPDVELTYDQLAALDFDPNASIRLALEALVMPDSG